MTSNCSNPPDLTNLRILVTGATGLIGARLYQRAASLGAHVYAVSRRASALEPGSFIWETAELTDPVAAEALIRRVQPNVIAHLASQVEGSRDRSLVLPMPQANLVAAVNVMLAA